MRWKNGLHPLWNHSTENSEEPDALAYVALRTEVNEWMNEEIKDLQTVLARQTEHIKNAQLAGASSANYEAASQTHVANLMLVQGAYHNVFLSCGYLI